MGKESAASVHGLRHELLGDDETPMASWALHHHWVVLTNQRILVLTGSDLLPHQRQIETAISLEDIKTIEVEPFEGKAGPDGSTPIQAHVGPGSGVYPMYSLSAGFPGYGKELKADGTTVVVTLDGTAIFLGYPKDAERIQEQIDEAHTRRRQDLGRPA